MIRDGFYYTGITSNARKTLLAFIKLSIQDDKDGKTSFILETRVDLPEPMLP